MYKMQYCLIFTLDVSNEVIISSNNYIKTLTFVLDILYIYEILNIDKFRNQSEIIHCQYVWVNIIIYVSSYT